LLGHLLARHWLVSIAFGGGCKRKSITRLWTQVLGATDGGGGDGDDDDDDDDDDI